MQQRLKNTNKERDFQLGEWRVKPASNEIVRHQETRRLEHKVMRLLVFFEHHAGRDLSREELLTGVWGEGVHNEEVLTVAVSSLRKVLEDDPKTPRFIKTVPRHGYHMLQAAEKGVDRSLPKSRWQWMVERVGLRFLIIAFLLAFVLLIILVQVIVELVYMLGR